MKEGGKNAMEPNKFDSLVFGENATKSNAVLQLT
jgi:hypothetical protein